MIYTVTFNPSLDYIVSVDDFRLGMTNRASSQMLLPGGKGINVSTVLRSLGLDSTALGFTAGFTGKEIEKRLDELGVKTDFIHLNGGNSRINVKLRNIEGTEINAQGPEIDDESLAQLMKRLYELKNGDMLVLAGSIPPSVPQDCYRKILQQLHEKEIYTVADTSGELLCGIAECRPFLIKPNNHELGELFQVTLRKRDEVIPYGKRLQRMGAQNVLISLAGEGAVLIAADGNIYSTPAPEGTLVNGVGAGDSMVAGFIAGFLKNRSYEQAFYMGVAAGSASAFSERLAGGDEIMHLYEAMNMLLS